MKKEERKEKKETTTYSKNQVIQEELGFEFNKPNSIVVKGSFDFNAVQQDLVNYILYKFKDVYKEIDKNDNNTYYKIKLNIKDILDTFNYENIPNNYTFIKDNLKVLRDKSIELKIYDEENKQEYIESFSIFTKYKVYTKYDKEQDVKDKIVKSTMVMTFDYNAYKIFDSDLDIDKFYTRYNFLVVFNIKGKYAKRLYDLFYYFIHKDEEQAKKENRKVKEKYEYTISFERLKYLLKMPYEYRSQIEREIIKAQKEINNKERCNLEFNYLIDKKKNNITFIFSRGNSIKHSFFINEQVRRINEKLIEKANEEEEIIDGQMSIFDLFDSKSTQ